MPPLRSHDDQGFRISERKPGLSPQEFAEYYEQNHVRR